MFTHDDRFANRLLIGYRPSDCIYDVDVVLLTSHRNKMAVTNEWTEDECRKLIENVKDQELRWKLDHADYGKRGPRFHAWRKISSAMQKGEFC